MKNLLLYALGGVTVIGSYMFLKKKRVDPALAAASNAAAALPPGNAAETSAANNSTGSINYTPTANLAGFNQPAKMVVIPQAKPGTVTYPPATTQVDPAKQTTNVIRYQAAAPIPSNFYYYPVDGDLWTILSTRLGGTPKARIVDPKNNSQIPIATLAMSDVGKLNGIVAYADMNEWLKAKKPLRLPVGGWNDVSGPVPYAMGAIR